MFELVLATVIALSTAAKVGLATATAASVIAVGGAAGVVRSRRTPGASRPGCCRAC